MAVQTFHPHLTLTVDNIVHMRTIYYMLLYFSVLVAASVVNNF